MNYTIPLATALALGVGIALGADAPAKTNATETATNVVVVISTNYGDITVELDASAAPITVAAPPRAALVTPGFLLVLPPNAPMMLNTIAVSIATDPPSDM